MSASLDCQKNFFYFISLGQRRLFDQNKVEKIVIWVFILYCFNFWKMEVAYSKIEQTQEETLKVNKSKNK